MQLSLVAQNGTWTPLGGGTFDWNTSANWSGSVPNGVDSIANLNVDITGNTTINLATDIQLDILNIGDTGGTTRNTITLGSLGGSRTITFTNGDAANAVIVKSGAALDVINPRIIAEDGINVTINDSGTLRLDGGLTISGDAVRNGLESVIKLGNGTLQVAGNTSVTALGALQTNAGTLLVTGALNHFLGGYNHVAGTANFRGANTMFAASGVDAIRHDAGTINLGTDSGTSRQFIAGVLSHANGNLFLGVNGGTSINTLYAQNLKRTVGGTFRFQDSNISGSVTTVLGGAPTTAVAGSISSGNVNIVLPSVTGLYAGMRVYAPGIPEGAVVQSVNSGTNTITLSQAPNVSSTNMTIMFAEGVASRAGTTTAGSNVITGLSNTTGYAVGQVITGLNIPEGSRITAIGPNSITLDANALGTGASTISSFAPSTMTLDNGVTQVRDPDTNSTNGTRGRVDFDPSISLVLKGNSSFHFTDVFSTASTNASTTLGSNVVTVSSTAGMKVGDAVLGTNIPNYARILAISGNNVTLSVAASNTGIISNFQVYENTPLQSLKSDVTLNESNAVIADGTNTNIFVTTGNGLLTIGNNSGVSDEFKGAINLNGSAANARVVKVGTNELILSGTRDNFRARVEVAGGTLVLAKQSSPAVTAIGNTGLLYIGDSDSANEVVRLSGSYTGAGFTPPTWLGSSPLNNYNDQVHFSSSVILNPTGIFDLNGFSEGINGLSGQGGLVTNNGGTLGTLSIGQNSATTTFGGTIQDGTSAIAVIKSGGGNLTFLGDNPYTGSTLVSRANLLLTGGGELSGTSSIRVSGNANLQVRNTFTLFNGQTLFNADNASDPNNPRDQLAVNSTQGLSVGQTIRGTNIPANTTILAILGDGRILISNNVTAAGTGLTFTVDGVPGAANSDRLNNSAILSLGMGTITLQNAENPGQSMIERIGGVVIDQGSNILRTQHDNAVDNLVRLDMGTYDRLAGGVALFVENSGSRGLGTGITPQTQFSQFTVDTIPNHLMIGDGGAIGTPAVNILQGAFGGNVSNSTNEFMTIQTVSGVNYIRPLAASEYAFVTSGSVTSNVGKLESNVSFLANTAANGIRFANLTTHTIADNVTLKLGGNNDPAFSASTTAGSGMAIFVSNGIRIQGGTIDTGSREFILRNNGSGVIQSRLTGSGGVNVAGGGYVDFYGRNTYTGKTYLTGDNLRAMASGSLGASGPGNGITVTANRTLRLGNSSTIGRDGGKDIEIGPNARLASLDGHNLWIGNVTVNAATDAGQNLNSFLRTLTHSSTLTIQGNVTGGGIPMEASYNGNSGRALWLIGDSFRDSIINITGELSDENFGSATLGDHQRLNIFTRGTADGTGDQFNEFHANLADTRKVHGILSIRSGFVRLGESYGTDSVEFDNPSTKLQLLLRSAGADSPHQINVLSMTKPGSVFNTRSIAWADNNAGYSATSYGMLAAEINTGKVVIGDGFGSLDLTPAADGVAGQSFRGTGTAVVGSQGNVITLTGLDAGKVFGNLRPGMQITGLNVPGNAYILTLDANTQTIVMSRPVTGTANATLNLDIVFNDAIAESVPVGDTRPANNLTQQYGDARLYAMAGGELELRARLLDDGGFSLNNEVGAVTKVGRGTVSLFGAQGLNGELDGGMNLHGGTLVLDYRTHNNRKITSGANQDSPLTLAGGDLWMRGNAVGTTQEELRGVLFLRSGNSQVRVQSGGVGNTSILNIGLPANLLNNVGMLPVHNSGATVSFWRDTSLGGNADITLEVPDLYTGNNIFPWATWVAPSGEFAGKVTDFAFVTAGNSPTDPLGVRDARGRGLFLSENGAEFMNDTAQQGNAKFGYVSESEVEIEPGEGTGFFGVYVPNNPDNLADPLRALMFVQDNNNTSGSDWVGNGGSRAEPNNVFEIASGQTLTLRSDTTSGFLGGAILVANTVGDTRKTIKGGSLSSQFSTHYFDPDINNFYRVTNDLFIHNYADPVNQGGGVFTIESNIVNNPASPTTPLNFVHSGTGWTKMTRATPTGPGYSYTGTTYFTGGVIWATDPNKLGATPTAVDSDNWFFNGGTLRIADMTNSEEAVVASVPVSQTLSSNRGITIGGDGAYIDLTKPGTSLTYGGIISAEIHAPSFAGGIVRTSNLGVGDLIKQGPGSLILQNQDAHTYSGVTEIQEGTLRVVIANPLPVSSAAQQLVGVLGSNLSFIDGTFVNAGARLEFQVTNPLGGTNEWITLDGGTLATTALNNTASLEGVLRVREDSVIEVIGGTMRLNSRSGAYIEGTGNLIKRGAGDLELYENNALYSGDLHIEGGNVFGTAQDYAFGAGTQISLGDVNSLVPATSAGLLLGSETTKLVSVTATTTAGSATVNTTSTKGLYPGMPITGPGLPPGVFINSVVSGTQFTLNTGTGVTAATGSVLQADSVLNTPFTYRVDHDLVINAEVGVFQQVKRIGAVNHGAILNSGQNFDRYEFRGNIALNDELLLSYTDNVINQSIAANGRDVVIALAGDLTGTQGLRSEIRYNGDSVGGNFRDIRAYFELSGNNTGWSGGLSLGNLISDVDQQHILRVMNTQSVSAANAVTLNSNATIQTAGNVVTIGSLSAGSAGSPQQIFIENASNFAGTIVLNQSTNAVIPLIFRNGTAVAYYGQSTDAPVNAALNVVKQGSGVLTLTALSSHSGTTQVGAAGGAEGGTLRLAVGGGISANSPLTVFGGAFELNGVSQSFNQAVTLGGGAAGTKAAIRTGSNTLTLNNNVVYNATNNSNGAEITGTVQMGAAPRTFTIGDSLNATIDLDVKANLLGSSSIIKTGQGTMSLGGANTFTGGVTVSQGTLLAANSSGSATGSGLVTVAPGATFGGTGSIAGDVNLTASVFGNEATLSVGSPVISSGIELLELEGTLSLGDFAIVEFYLGQTGFSQLSVDTFAPVASSTLFRIKLDAGYSPTAGASFNIMDWTTRQPGGDLNWLDNLELPVGFSWNTSEFYTDGVIRINGVGQPVLILSDPQPIEVDPGQPAVFSVVLSGTEPWLIQWKKDNVPINGATGLTYTIPSAIESDEGNYSVEVTNGINTVFSLNALLTVNDVPQITGPPTGGTINPGDNFTFTVVASSATGYQWKLNDNDIPGATNPTYNITGATEANQGTYTVVVSNLAGSITSDPVDLNVNDPVVIVADPQDQPVPLGTEVTFSVTVTGTEPMTFQWRRNGININGATNPTLTLTAASNNLGSYTVVVNNVVGVPAISGPGVLSEVASPVDIISQPTPQIVAQGGTVTLECQAIGALPLKYQWRRNGINVAGATSPTLVLTNVGTNRAGSYTCFVSNTTGGGPTNDTTNAVDVAVVNTAARTLILREGSTATLSITAAGNVAYQWFKDDGTGEVQLSATDKTLRLSALTVADKGNYFCRVSLVGTALTLDGGMNDLTVFNAVPDIDDSAWNFPATIISELYEFKIPLADGSTPGEPDPAKTPTKYVASGLPPGLKIDSFGWVRGRATAVRYFPKGHPQEGQVAPYLVTVTASNAVGKDVVTSKELVVNPLPGGVVGVYTGPIARNLALNLGAAGTTFGLGGRIDVTTTAKGTYSGKILLGTKTYSFKGALDSDVNAPNQSSVTATISRGKTLPPLILNFTLDATDDLLKLGSVTDGTETAVISGWRNKWVKTKTLPTPAAEYQGYYTLGLDIPVMLAGTATHPNIPQGLGFASFTVNGGTARLSVSGRTPDGTAITSATFVGPTGQVLVFRTLYAANARGSVLGQFTITTAPSNLDNTLAGAVSWWRPATPSATARLYKDGFDPMDLTVAGSRYTPPISPGIVMNIPNVATGVPNANLSFVEANVESASPAGNFVSVNVNFSHKVAVTSANERKTTLAINPRTGAISGRFSLSDAHPDLANGGKPATINRTVSYLGMIVRDNLGTQGVGYFLLPQLPATKDIPVGRTPILSGQVLFDRLP